MNTKFQYIINQLRSEGKDYTDFKHLLVAIKASGADVSKDEILEFVSNDYRIQLHTTPNSIAKLIAHLAKRSQAENAIDICCGTGNILYYLQNEIDDLTGVEILENVAELTKYFIPGLHIITADTFQYPFQSKYDLVVGNMPFGMRIELDGKRIPGEEAFLRKAHELLSDKGRAIMLVPYSVMINEQFKDFRNEFVQYLQEVIILPSGSIRKTQIKTALLIFNKKGTKEIKTTRLQQFENLHQEYAVAEHNIYSKEQFNKRWDAEYDLTRENSFYKELDNFQTKELHELAEIIKGKEISADTLKPLGDYLYLKPAHIQKDGLILEGSLKYIAKENLSEHDYRYILQPGDIVISTIFNDLKMYVYQTGDTLAIASNNIAIIRSSFQDYILTYLQTDDGKRVFKTQAEDFGNGIAIPYLSIKDLASIKIPILPVADLNKFGNEFIRKASKNELLNQIETLNNIRINNAKEFDVSIVAEPSVTYGNASLQTEIIKAFFEDRFRLLMNQVDIANKKLDRIVESIEDFKKDFDTIRSLPRNHDEILFKLCQNIDFKLDKYFTQETKTIEGYVIEVKRWLDLWELLDLQSQKFLPIAEFLFDELSKLKDADYAPFVVQYCRTLENEILKKLFEAYHTNGLQGVNREELVKGDFDNSNTRTFASMVKKDKQSYTLGEMSFIMSLLKDGGNTLAESSLLKHFRSFTISYFDEKIVEAEFLNDVNKITNDFRNKAAHPYSISVDLAKECQVLLRKSLNVFLESVKNVKL